MDELLFFSPITSKVVCLYFMQYHRTPVVEGGSKRRIRFSTVNPKFLMLADIKFQSLGRDVVKENEYEEVRWDDIVGIVSWRERVFRLWWEERTHFDIGCHARIPTRNTILRWVASFRTTGSTLKKKSPGRNSIALRLSEATSRAVASWSKASCLGLALVNARRFESSWGKKFSHEISASIWDQCQPSSDALGDLR
ncbi:hypothetical protein ANN_19009 [Periplaneta americana]|uniref:Uncharacterized protein n=1 Tax=Periplaneta americana TaxID=6978 RepID=A0ABQ8SQB2_PERAM|nr:hypothetical protein ANN_19009 [Periplaneta americana]